jgi:hypothetical protein
VKPRSSILERLPVWAATASLLFTSAAYGWFQRTRTPLLGMDADWLVAIVNVEFLVVHSFPFLLMVALQRPRLPQWQGVRGLAFGLLLLMYFTGAHDLAGWQGVGLFASLAAVTYLGFFVRFDEGIHKFPELGLRWLCNTILLISLAAWFQLPSDAASWDVGNGVLPVGGLYFLCLAGLELSGFYQKPLLLDAGRRIPGGFDRIGGSFPRSSELYSGHGPVYWAVAPILGSAALNLGPLLLAGYVAGAGARFIDASFDWPRSAHIEQWWFPAIMALILLSVRCYQLHWLLKDRARNVILSFLIALYLLVAFFRYRADPTYHFAYSSFPADAYEGFLLVEIPLLLFLVPATWLRLAFPKVNRSTRTSASGS